MPSMAYLAAGDKSSSMRALDGVLPPRLRRAPGVLPPPRVSLTPGIGVEAAASRRADRRFEWVTSCSSFKLYTQNNATWFKVHNRRWALAHHRCVHVVSINSREKLDDIEKMCTLPEMVWPCRPYEPYRPSSTNLIWFVGFVIWVIVLPSSLSYIMYKLCKQQENPKLHASRNSNSTDDVSQPPK